MSWGRIKTDDTEHSLERVRLLGRWKVVKDSRLREEYEQRQETWECKDCLLDAWLLVMVTELGEP